MCKLLQKIKKKLDLNDHGIVFCNVCILYVDRKFID